MANEVPSHIEPYLSVSAVRLPNLGTLDLPAYSTRGSSGMDLCAALEGLESLSCCDADCYPRKLHVARIRPTSTVDPTPCVRLDPGVRLQLPTGIKIAIPRGFEGQVRSRSGLAYKEGVRVLNAPGTIDSDYRGEVCVLLFNVSSQPFAIYHGMRVAQLVIGPVVTAGWNVVEKLEETVRGEGGFGSTGT